MTMDQDLASYEAHARLIEVAKSVNPKVAKINAARDIKVARAKSMNADTRIGRYVAIVVVLCIMSMGGCSAYVWGQPKTNEQIQYEKQSEVELAKLRTERFKACVDAGGDYDYNQGDCDNPDN